MKLIIVESPHKATTISNFLPKDYKVIASKGHIRDLASTGKMGLGVDIDNNFKPNYVISDDKKNIVKDLKSHVNKADEVLLATDPDREGEAISWHLADTLNLDINNTKRLEFHEITKSAINSALINPRKINMNLVESQETRRIIDRLMGYRLSNLLQSKIKSKSAGRVQSVVLRFIVEREREIRAFIPSEYWTIEGEFKKDKSTVKANLISYKDNPIKISSEEEANKVIKSLPDKFVLSSKKVEKKLRNPKAPFITSSLQQEAYSQFGFSPSKTAAIAQKLYEGFDIGGTTTGLITYMRTDSIRLADEFIVACQKNIEEKYGTKYIGKIQKQDSSKNVQDAHEAIRPTDVMLTHDSIKEYLGNDEYKLYTLIYDRAYASLMASRQDEITSIDLKGNDYTFHASELVTKFDGFYKVYGKYEEKETHVLLPIFNEGDVLSNEKIEKAQHFTKPPLRYNEGKVVKLMQENGIGRPSTYAPTISTLLSHNYLENQKGSLVPTEQGELTVDKLVEFFPQYMDAKYTSDMENSLDDIAEGKEKELDLLKTFWGEFTSLFDNAKVSMEKIKPVEVGRNCPKCGSPLVERKSKYGKFIGCSNYPDCDYLEKEQKEVEILNDRKCPVCGGNLIKRKSKRGEFYGCSNFPKCNYMEDLNGQKLTYEKKKIVIPDDAPLCPKCKEGHLIEKKSRYGKTFIACSNYPKCKYIQDSETKKTKTTKKALKK